MSGEEPLVRWGWIGDHLGELAHYTGLHLELGLLPVLFGLIISVPVGMLCHRWRWLYPPTLTAANVLYAIPSLALFMVFVRYTGLTERTVMIPLTLYTLSVLVPNVVDGLASVPAPVRQAATAMGFSTLRRVARVELPVAVPVVVAGVRVASVSSISLVAVGQLVGQGGLGFYITRGLQLDFPTPIITATVLIVLLALVTDAVLVAAQRLLTPWSRGSSEPEPARGPDDSGGARRPGDSDTSVGARGPGVPVTCGTSGMSGGNGTAA